MIKSSRREFVSVGVAAALIGAIRSASGSDGPPVESLKAESLVEPTRALLDGMRAAALGPFLADWPVATERRVVTPSAVPVLRLLPEVQAAAPAFSRELVNDIGRAASSMAWRQTYTVADVGAAFLENYGWSEVVGTTGPLASERVACGFLLLGPQTHYPLHQHEAEEIYIPLVGTASWLQAKGGWQKRPPGTVIYHASNEPHATRTGTHPLLALYLWRSANLRQKAHFVS
jgi:hypothetical protein